MYVFFLTGFNNQILKYESETMNPDFPEFFDQLEQIFYRN